MKLALRILLWVTYPFLVLSSLLMVGTLFTLAFVVSFSIENRTAQTIAVTPVGTAGEEGRKWPLPTVVSSILPLPAGRAGGFRLAPGESVTILYDMDDINFSEIVVEDQHGGRHQLVVDPQPTTNQYHAPSERRFVIDDLKSLSPVDPGVSVAAGRAQGHDRYAIILNVLLIAPWAAYAGLRLTLARLRTGPARGGEAW